jgi:formylglycine-generating enzyme
MKTPVSVLVFGFAALSALPACTRAAAKDREVAVGAAALKGASVVTEPEDAPPRQEAREPAPPPACPEGMILVEGEYCPEVEHVCLEWMDPPSSRYHHFRCKRYKQPATCKSARVHKRFCIDATERKEEGTDLPRHHMSWTTSKKLCESEGARLCRESEWQFACEGEEMVPYPYGWERDSEACNVDRSTNIGRVGRLVDHRAEVASHPKCASPFGVQDMAGNVEEWAQADGPGKGSKMGWKEVLKGSWWIPSRHACRQFQIGHDDVYQGAETGTRCCKDAPPPSDTPTAP